MSLNVDNGIDRSNNLYFSLKGVRGRYRLIHPLSISCSESCKNHFHKRIKALTAQASKRQFHLISSYL